MMEAIKPKRGRPKIISDEAQREIIVRCATELFLEKGYGSTTTDDVTTLCRISKQTLYRLFTAKSALFAAVIEAHRDQMIGLPGNYDHLPIDEALEQIFLINISDEANRERTLLLRLVISESSKFPELSDILERYGPERTRQDLTRWLTHQRRRGLIQIDDVRSAGQMLLDMIFGSIIAEAVSGVQRSEGVRRRAHIRRCISVFLNGVRPR